MEKDKQIVKCQDAWSDGRSYNGWFDYAESEHKAGRKQVWCATCERFKFPGEKCPLFVEGKAPRATRKGGTR